MAETKTRIGALDTPLEARARLLPRLTPNPDAFGKATEKFARFMGTPQFLMWMTVFCALWLAWNTFGPESLRFDSAALGFTALTLMLSLQASYAAPLLLLAQNRQDDRDKVSLQQDRQRAERNLADTEYLTRELAALRIALREVATRDFVRSELRSVLEELLEEDHEQQRPVRRVRKKKPSDTTMALPRVTAPAPADRPAHRRDASGRVAGSEQ
ncbi:DUF1003 domain-containing protein [Arthrobacter sp. GCM10027362]|uniref:DUF1003 domain-containing protein n=1 Tax=Arthrobacter sp. GCM10027362 TaxID=3273379 RepID=UPI00363FCBD1